MYIVAWHKHTGLWDHEFYSHRRVQNCIYMRILFATTKLSLYMFIQMCNIYAFLLPFSL